MSYWVLNLVIEQPVHPYRESGMPTALPLLELNGFPKDGMYYC